MNFDNNLVNKLDKGEENILLLKDGLFYYTLSIILIILGMCCVIYNHSELGIFWFIIAAAADIYGLRNLFLKGEKRKKLLTSKLVSREIKKNKKAGNKLSKEKITKIKFKYDPLYHDKVVELIHKEDDEKYENKIRECNQKLNELFNARENEIKRLNSLRWQSIGTENFKYNMVEGKVSINQNIFNFSSIKGAEIYRDEANRTVTYESGYSKKRGSLGGAIVGGVLLGPIGALAGGTMSGKTRNSGSSISNTIPICSYLSVRVNIDGFINEIILLNSTVDQNTPIYQEAQKNAMDIVAKLQYLSTQPVPDSYVEVEKMPTVLDLDKEIENARLEVSKAKKNIPKYEVPEKYL